MSDLRSSISARIDAFLRELEALLRDAALATVRDALGPGAHAASAATSGGTQRTGAPKRATVFSRRRVAKPRAVRRVSRSGTLRDRVLQTLAQGGEMGRSQVAKALGVSKKSVETPLRLLFQAGKIARTGSSAQTRYAAKK